MAKVEETRDKQSMGNYVTLTPNKDSSAQGGPYSMRYSAPMTGEPGSVVTGGGEDWFGPLNPMNPTAPPDVKGRILDYQSGYNLNIRPRSGEMVSFEQLRAFADNYDLLRLLIETRKDQMARMGWNISPRDKSYQKTGGEIPADVQTRIKDISEFFYRPDKELFWDEWLRMVLEDMFVIDAATIYRRNTRGGELYALQQIDGATIKRVIDDWGNTPEAPVPAYQQVLKGYPAVNYEAGELIYRPRVKRVHKIYGYSPVEQILMTINIGMRRQVWQLQSFTEGNIPEALIGTPDTWTPDQVRQFQDWFDGMMTGNTAERRRARFVPGEVAKSYVPTKPAELFGAAEEWLVRVMCFAFSISPQPFVAMMNRATAESAQEAAISEGLAPIQNWVKGLIDTILIDDFDSPDLEFGWEEEDELDPNIKSEIIDREQKAGRMTYNETRKEQGLSPMDDPEADRPMVFLPATGWTPIFLNDEEKALKDAQHEAALAGATMAKDNFENPPESGAEETPPGAEDKPGGTAPPKPGVKPPVTPPKPGEVAKKSDTPFSKADGGKTGCNHDHHLSKASKPVVAHDPLRPFAARHEKHLSLQLKAVLAKLGKKVAKQVKEALSKVAKAEYPDDFDIDALLASLDLDILSLSQDDIAEALTSLYGDAGRIAISQLGSAVDADAIVEQVNERALSWARDRAAELVSFDEDTDPLIAQTTRDMIRADIADGIENNLSTGQIGDILEENYAFSEERADLIAATEITSANSMGSLASYEEAANMGVTVQKSWLVLEDGCEVCQENADAGAIDLDEDFPSGDAAPGAHPNCRCVLVPEVADEQGNTTEGEPGEGDDAELADRPEFTKADNRDEMSKFFPVDTDRRGAAWSMGGNNEAAITERETSNIQHVSFDDCIATQDYCDRDKVRVYLDDPTAKGFAPMVYFDGTDYAIQDGHHRAVASKISGNSGMSMNVRSIGPLED